MLIKDQLYALQLLEYEPIRFLRWILKNPFRFGLEKKKKLVYTSKARFLLITATIIPILLLTIESLLLSAKIMAVGLFALKTTAAIISYALFPWIYLTISVFILKIYEIPNRQRAINQAKQILSSHPNLIVIGITGSYGKTTVKEILDKLLGSHYKVLATPRSFNTLFGIAKIIKENLKSDHEIFIVEMGAYKRGEIAELCRMVKPKIGILTGITRQHLERFGSTENIIKAKYELIEALPSDGLAVFNLENESCQKLYEKTIIKKLGYATKVSSVSKNVDFQAELQAEDSHSTLFTIQDVRIKRSLTNLRLNLPGNHNVSNAIAAITVAFYLNLSEEEIRQALNQVQSPEHRLQFLKSDNGSLIIDDSYSSNPEGVKAAIKLVRNLPNQPKIIVTPGMVELGEKQYEENKKFGKLIAESFDYAVIVNKTNRRALLEGLLSGGWFFLKHTLAEHLGFSAKQLENYNVPEEIDNRVFVADSLNQATQEIIPQLVRPGSLILFENDLPDIYE